MFDLHVHTKASDGTLGPDELFKLAQKTGLKGIGITDHDTVDTLNEAVKKAEIYDIKVIPGVELSTYWQEHEIHILGYLIDCDAPQLIDKLSFFQQQRQERMIKMIAKANQMGYPISIGEIEELAKGKAVGRPHLAQALLRKGYINSISEGFNKFLNNGKPFYVPRFKISPMEAIKLIIGANGLPVLAHPGLYSCNWKILLPELIADGLVGLEVFYPKHSTKLTRELSLFSKQHNLITTGGSDFHGIEVKPVMLGDYGVNDEIIKQMEERKKYF